LGYNKFNLQSSSPFLSHLQIALSAAPEVIHSGHHHGIDMNHPILALTVTIASISIKEGLYWITKRAGEKQGSGLMMANAWHHRSDAISSLVALVGVGKLFFPISTYVNQLYPLFQYPRPGHAYGYY
jgi:divalent metal cation (Fe/Co/Zn/Cd) transporter